MPTRRKLPKRDILRGEKAFKAVFERGQFRRGRYLACLYLPAPESKVAFAVSKQVRGAVRRNRIRRRLREVYRLNRHALQQPGWLVLFGRDVTAEVSFSELEADFRQLVSELCTK